MIDKEYKLAHFKAKYGASNRMMSSLLQSSPSCVREWAEKDTTPKEIEVMIDRLEYFIQHMIKEHKLLGDHAPYLQVIEHDKERMAVEIEGLKNSRYIIEHKLKQYENLTLWRRLRFLFGAKIEHSKATYVKEHDYFGEC